MSLEKTLRLEWRSPDELAENPKNWRRHPDSQIAALTDTIAEVGWAGACLFNERTGRLIDGHARKKVALSQGADKIPVLVGDWDEATENKILATLDPLAAMAEADKAALDALLADVNTQSEAINAMLTELVENAEESLPEPGDGGDEFDTTPETSGPTRTATGDLWLIGGKHRLLVGDCTDAANVALIMNGKRAGLCFTSPPYNVGTGIHESTKKNCDRSGKYESSNDSMPQDDYLSFLFLFTKEALSVSDVVVVNVQEVVGNRLALAEYRYVLRKQIIDTAIWNKGFGQPAMAKNVMNSSFEYILFFSPTDDPGRAIPGASFHGTVPNVYTGNQQNANEFHEVHSATFPLHLPTWIIETFTPIGSIVYDPFLGSGTTLIAAHRLNRICYGCEIEPRYADVILKRAEAEGLTCVKE